MDLARLACRVEGEEQQVVAVTRKKHTGTGAAAVDRGRKHHARGTVENLIYSVLQSGCHRLMRLMDGDG